MRTDYHTHILPNMDDGAATVQDSADLIFRLKQQGVERIVLTPHFNAEQETVEAFLQRRESSYRQLKAHPQAASFPPLILGAEVRIQRGICRLDELPRLCLEGTKCLMLELPFTMYQPWMFQEVENVAFRLKVTPLLAHMERYLLGDIITREDWQQFVEFGDTVTQFGPDVFENRELTALVIRMLKDDYPIVFGSDTHNAGDRAPNFRAIPHKIWRKFELPDLF